MIISPNRKDFWRFPVYRSLIPRLIKQPQVPIQFLQKEKVWMVGERKIVIKGGQLGALVELITRLFREVLFFFNKSYRVQFFAAKDRIERAYEEAIGREKNDRWEFEEKKEKVPEIEKKAQEQLKRLKQINESGQKTLQRIHEESIVGQEALRKELEALLFQKQCWEDFNNGNLGEENYVKAVCGLEKATGELVHFLEEIDRKRMQDQLDAEIAKKEAELEEKKKFDEDALEQIRASLQAAEKRKEKIQAVVQKIPHSPLKQVSEKILIKEPSLERVKTVLFQEENPDAS